MFRWSWLKNVLMIHKSRSTVAYYSNGAFSEELHTKMYAWAEFCCKMWGAGWCETNILQNLKRKCRGNGILYPHCLKKWGTHPPCPPPNCAHGCMYAHCTQLCRNENLAISIKQSLQGCHRPYNRQWSRLMNHMNRRLSVAVGLRPQECRN